MAQLSHYYFPTIHRAGSWCELDYFEIDFVEGHSLKEHLKFHGPFTLQRGLALALELSRALEYIHMESFHFQNQKFFGILHRDIKPSNIMLSRRRGVTLIDFGISSVSKNGLFPTTVDGRIVGSLPYLAPEMLRDKRATFKADIFSMGTVFYELFVGKRAFPEEDLTRLVQQRKLHLYEPLKQQGTKLPRELEQLIMAMLEDYPEDRPYSMRQVRLELERIYRKISKEEAHSVVTSSLCAESKVIAPTEGSLYDALSRVAMR